MGCCRSQPLQQPKNDGNETNENNSDESPPLTLLQGLQGREREHMLLRLVEEYMRPRYPEFADFVFHSGFSDNQKRYLLSGVAPFIIYKVERERRERQHPLHHRGHTT